MAQLPVQKHGPAGGAQHDCACSQPIDQEPA